MLLAKNIVIYFPFIVLMAGSYTFLTMTTLDRFILPGLNLGKLYSNSLLVMLNSRFVIVGGRHTEDDMCVSLYAESRPDAARVPSNVEITDQPNWKRLLGLHSFLLCRRRRNVVS